MEAAVYTIILVRSSICTDAEGADTVVRALNRGERVVRISTNNPFDGTTQEFDVQLDSLLTIIKHDVTSNPAVRKRLDAPYKIVSMDDYVARRNRPAS